MNLTTTSNFRDLASGLIEFVNLLIPAIFALVFLVIVWKIIDAWVINGADQEKRAEGKQLLLIAIIVLVLMVSTWGIIALIRDSFFGA